MGERRCGMTNPPDDVYLMPDLDFADEPSWDRGAFFSSRKAALEAWPDCPYPAPARYVPYDFLEEAEGRAEKAREEVADIILETNKQIAHLERALNGLALAVDGGREAEIREAREEAGRALL
jgi:hypothetical protein